MKEYKITKERLRAMVDECPEVERALKKGFPEAFKEKKRWVDITRVLEVEVDKTDLYYLIFKYEGEQIAYSHCSINGCGGYDHQFIHLDDEKDYRIEWDGGNFRILKWESK